MDSADPEELGSAQTSEPEPEPSPSSQPGLHSLSRYEEAAAEQAVDDQYVLYLYVTGSTPRSTQAIINIKKVCEEHLQGRYHLEVIDIYQQPELAGKAQIVATPTLVKLLPVPLRRLIGDLSNSERVLTGLGLAHL